MCHGPGVQVVAKVPVAGPVPPPSMVVTPESSASSICCGQMKWMWLSMPPAVTIMPSPAMTSVPGPMTIVDAGLDVRVAGLADGGDAAVLEADVGLDDAGDGIDDQRVGDHRIDHLGRAALALAHAVADDLAAAEFHFLAVDREVLLDLDEQLGVGQAQAVADATAMRRAEHFGIGLPADFRAHYKAP